MFTTSFLRTQNKRYTYSNLRIVILCFISSVILSFISCVNKEGNIAYNRAIGAHDKGNYQEACDYYEQAINTDPENSLNNHDEIYTSWGVALAILAKNENNKDLYESSIDKYKKATEINPNNSYVYNNWGLTLICLAELENSKKLYEEIFEKYKKATELNPSSFAAYNNWGLALLALAKLENSKELYEASLDKFKKTTELNPKYSGAYNNWGTALYELARLENNIEEYKNDIFEVLLKAEKFEEGSGAFNLARLHSLLNEKDTAFKYLKSALWMKKTPGRDWLEKDTDFDNLKSDPRFEELLNKYYPKDKN